MALIDNRFRVGDTVVLVDKNTQRMRCGDSHKYLDKFIGRVLTVSRTKNREDGLQIISCKEIGDAYFLSNRFDPHRKENISETEE